MDEETQQSIERIALRGRPMPRSLVALWSEDEDVLAETFGITKLLTDMSEVDEVYGEALAVDPDHARNLRAYRAVFEQLGFFAQLDDGELLAYWLAADGAEPPVVKLDGEGLLSFEGANLGEALFRLVEGRRNEGAGRDWLAAAGMPAVDLPEVGVSTQFLPDLEKLQQAIAARIAGEADPEPTPRATPIDPHDASTWVLQPAAAVEAAIAGALTDPLREFVVWTTGGGLVKNLALKQGLAKKVTVLGISKPSTRTEIERALGAPDQATNEYVSYLRDGVDHNFRLDPSGTLKSINLAARG